MKRRGRLSDTAGLVSRGFDSGESHSVSVRQVGDQYLTSTTRYNPKTGMCETAEQITKSPPKIEPARVRGGEAYGAVGCETLGDTKRYMGRNV